MIIAILTILHILMCIALILIILLQTGKGSELAGAFGGGTSNTAFGVTGAISFIGKMTTVAAFCFLFTSFSLSLLPRGGGDSSVIKEESAPQAPQAPLEDEVTEIGEGEAGMPEDSSSSETGIQESESDMSYSDDTGTNTEEESDYP